MVVITELEHHANFVPWQQIARRTGAEFRAIPFDDNGELVLESLDELTRVGPVKVVAAMEGLTVKSFNGDVTMRKSDHQLQQPLFISVWQKADAKYPYSPEKTGMTLAPVKQYDSYVSSTPTSCQMKRPG